MTGSGTAQRDQAGAAGAAGVLAAIVGERLASTVQFSGVGALPSVYRVTDLAAAAVASAGLAVSELLGANETGTRPQGAPAVSVDRRLASLWFGSSLRPIGWEPPPSWDAIAGDYEASDGWLRLHTNVPAHRAAALSVLGVAADRGLVSEAVAAWRAAELEAAVIAAGGCAAVMRSPQAWAESAAGRSVAAEPLVRVEPGTAGPRSSPAPDPARPLAGVRVLDLTRVLAGPVATRFLALLGADVLRIDPPWWDEPGLVPDVGLGKRSARLDLRRSADYERCIGLIAEADVLIHGYRPGALDGLGLDPATRARARPGLAEVALTAYGSTGPFAARRGFDSLVQMSTGIAETGMRELGRDRPTPLPVQALDHATGYLMAAAAIRAIAEQRRAGHGTRATLSLARTASLLARAAPTDDTASLLPETAEDLAPGVEHTAWGQARRLRAPLTVSGVSFSTDRPARPLGSDPASW
ncbi:CoA transferase [Leucobacter komagatae]|uniref:CAIB/BAIF family CoA transferase n=1 Tax=Leucobacter komagatae TaxID=55969 RepID=A0A0D0I211_9MICO|nr:CoA transferase [Leucobacter komagatae]KIP53771.1 CAIB/BAIF family CoA transferase [Leucobacter komagatae]